MLNDTAYLTLETNFNAQDGSRKAKFSEDYAVTPPSIFCLSLHDVQQLNCLAVRVCFTTGGRAKSCESLAIAESWLHLAKAQKSAN